MHHHQYQLEIRVTWFLTISTIVFSSQNDWQSYAASHYLFILTGGLYETTIVCISYDLAELPDSDSNYRLLFYCATQSLGCQIHLVANSSAQNADHLMLPGKSLFTCENESCELTDHSTTFRSPIIPNLRSRNFFGHSNTLSLRREESYKLAIHNFSPQFNFLLFCIRGLCANLISTGIDKYFVLYFTAVKCTNVLNSRHYAICVTNRNGSWGHVSCLACKQHADHLMHSVNARNELSTNEWRQFLDLKSLLLSSIQTHKLSVMKDQKGELPTLFTAGTQCTLEPLRPSNWVSCSINWASRS